MQQSPPWHECVMRRAGGTEMQHSVKHLTRACSAIPFHSPDVSRRASGTTVHGASESSNTTSVEPDE
eukprot:145959-Alexandrium_andersonii.AAC.1